MHETSLSMSTSSSSTPLPQVSQPPNVTRCEEIASPLPLAHSYVGAGKCGERLLHGKTHPSTLTLIDSGRRMRVCPLCEDTGSLRFVTVPTN